MESGYNMSTIKKLSNFTVDENMDGSNEDDNDNLIIPIFTVALLVTSLILLIWAYFKDKNDVSRSKMTFLQDNTPGDTYAYVVVVYTGRDVDAGTSANVGIQLFGTEHKSKPHILNDIKKQVLTSGSDDWFVLTTASTLGNLEELHLWHDGSGSSPLWLCHKVIVFDVQTRQMWTFLVDQWLSVEEGDDMYCVAHPATWEETLHWIPLFKSNLRLLFMEQHTWIRIFARHPRSTFTRCQRVAVATCLLMTCSFIILWFYGLPSEDTDDGPSEYTFSWTQLLVALKAALLTYPFTLFIVLFFRKSEPMHPKHRHDKELTQVQVHHKSSKAKTTRRTVRFSYEMNDGSETVLFIPTKEEEEAVLLTRKDKLVIGLIGFFVMNPLTAATFDIYETDDEARKSRRGIINRFIHTIYSIPSSIYKTLTYKSDLQDRSLGKYWFPHWCNYIGWLLCIILTVISSFLLIQHGSWSGPGKSWTFVATVVCFLILSIFILQPLRVFFLAIVITSLLQKQPHHKKIEWEIPIKPHHVSAGHFKHMTYTEQRKYHKIYQTLHQNEVKMIRDEYELRSQLKSTLIDFVLYIFYITILLWLISGRMDNMFYYSTKTIRDMFVDVQYPYEGEITPLDAVVDDNTFMQYVTGSLEQVIYNVSWYNDEPLFHGDKDIGNKPVLMADLNSMLMNVPKVRQLRVLNDTCIINPRLSHIIKHCYEPFSLSIEDTKDYDVGWKPLRGERNKSSMWVYEKPEDSLSLPIRGYFGNYPTGGYTKSIGRTIQEVHEEFLKVAMNEYWIDRHTRAIIFDFVAYNVNRNIFSVIWLLIERGATGVWRGSYQVKTLKVHVTLDELERIAFLSLLFFFIILMAFAWRQYDKMRRISFKAFFEDGWNIFDIVVVAVGVSGIGVFIARNVESTNLIETYKQKGQNYYVSFNSVVYWNSALTVVISILVCMSTIRLWKILRFGYDFRMLELILYEAKGAVSAVFALFFIIVVAFSAVFQIVLGNSYSQFSTFGTAISSLVTGPVILQFQDTSELLQGSETVGKIFYIMFIIGVCVIYTDIIVTVILVFYSYAEEELQSVQHEYTLLDYIKDNLGLLFGLHSEHHVKLKMRRAQDFEKTVEFVAPKPREIQEVNAMYMSIYRLESIRLFILMLMGENHDVRQRAMTAIAVDTIQQTSSSIEVEEELFHEGVDVKTGFTFVPEERLMEIEATFLTAVPPEDVWAKRKYDPNIANEWVAKLDSIIKEINML